MFYRDLLDIRNKIKSILICDYKWNLFYLKYNLFSLIISFNGRVLKVFLKVIENIERLSVCIFM